jgi:hypothetical protein
VFSSSVYVCYMWDWVMWRVYWLCCVEIWRMCISISWTLCVFLYWHLLCHCSVHTEDTVTYSYHCHNDSRLYCVYTSCWIHCTMICPDQCCNHSTTVTWTSLISVLPNWTVQCVHLHNVQLISDSMWLHSHSWIEETEVDNWMKIVKFFANLCVNF